MALRPHTILARKLRRASTEAEQQLWHALRELPLPCRLRRQHPVGRYIADFAFPARRLIVELDGGQHMDQTEADEIRTRELRLLGYRVIRFWNNEVMENIKGVVMKIVEELEKHPPPPTPARGRRGINQPPPSLSEGDLSYAWFTREKASLSALGWRGPG